MLCAKRLATFMFVASCTTLLSATATSAQESWKLYDLRDLIDLLPAPSPPPRAAQTTPRASFLGTPTTRAPAPQRDPVDELIRRICGDITVDHRLLFQGIYGVLAEEEAHMTLVSRLESVRELYTQRYDVEILWFPTPVTQSPTIGAEVNASEPLHRDRLVVTGRAPARLIRVSQLAYVSGIDPIVGTGAMGYASETDVAESGLNLSILVGAGRETGTGTSIRIRGELREVTMGKMSGPVATMEARSMEIELPTISIRSIQSNIGIEYGKLTALAVVDGFRSGECIVVAASIVPRRAE